MEPQVVSEYYSKVDPNYSIHVTERDNCDKTDVSSDDRVLSTEIRVLRGGKPIFTCSGWYITKPLHRKNYSHCVRITMDDSTEPPPQGLYGEAFWTAIDQFERWRKKYVVPSIHAICVYGFNTRDDTNMREWSKGYKVKRDVILFVDMYDDPKYLDVIKNNTQLGAMFTHKEQGVSYNCIIQAAVLSWLGSYVLVILPLIH